MINAKQEFLDHINERYIGGRTVRCAKISIKGNHTQALSVFILPIGYTAQELQVFLCGINQDYDNSYGEQLLFGTIWYDDGITWSQRGEYDGREWYEFMEIPEIPPELMGDADSRI